MQFNLRYFSWTVLLLLIEISIALFLDDPVIRPFVGDILVVILIYCFLRSFLKIPIVSTAVYVFIFACLVEFSQYLKLVDKLGLSSSSLALTVLGTSFSWVDVLIYLVGIVIILVCEILFSGHKPPASRID